MQSIHKKGLGELFDISLHFYRHVKEVITSTLKMLGFIVENTISFTNKVALKTLSFVQNLSVLLNILSDVLSFIICSYITSLENVQERFLKLLYLKRF